MTDYMSVVLDELVPRLDGEQGDWERVMRDAEVVQRAPARPLRAASGIGAERGGVSRRQNRRLTPRRLVIAVAIVAAIVIPVAVAASQEWWFFRFGNAPRPVTGVNVVKAGSWDGKQWQLTAYGSATDGICFSMTPTPAEGSTGQGAAMSCDQIEGVPRTPESKPYTPHAITYLAGASEDFPPYIVGPVIDTAEEVVIHLANGTVLRTPTFDVPKKLGAVRFYATRLLNLPPRRGLGPGLLPRKLVGLGDDGRIVACLVVPVSAEGVPLSECR